LNNGTLVVLGGSGNDTLDVGPTIIDGLTTVTFNGVTKVFDAGHGEIVNHILFRGRAGNDTATSHIAGDFFGGSGDDSLQADGYGGSTFDGGTGTNTLTGSQYNDGFVMRGTDTVNGNGGTCNCPAMAA
jgi:hypothetical protein